MNIIVAGCGKIGRALVSNLVSEGHDVTVMDNSPKIIEQMTETFDVMGICGNCADCETLEEAGAADTDIFVAVTDSDELNMLSCFLAQKIGASHTIARIRNPEYNDQSLGFMRQHLGISISINPELLIAYEINKIVKLPSAVKVENFSRRALEMVEIILPQDSELDGMTLVKIREKYKANYLICTVQREDEVYIPDGSFTLRSGDRIGLIAAHAEIEKLLRMLGLLKKQVKDVIILGGGKASYYLAAKLCELGTTVKIIEKRHERCEELSSLLPDAVIIHGDGAQQEFLLEEGLASTDAFISLTGNDEQNIMLSVFASMHNVPKVISKINRDELLSMAEKLGVESIISPTQITSNIVVRYARAIENSKGSNVETLYKLMDGRAEALEFNAKENSLILDTPLMELKLKPNTLVAGIIRGRKTIIPSGKDMILSGDKVVVISAGQRFNDLDDILSDGGKSA